MAGATVPISFPTETVSLQRATELLKQSKTATEQLRTASKQLGTDTTTAGRQMTSTLEGMRLKLAQLKGQIDNTSQANTAQLQKLSAEYKSLEKEINTVTKQLYEQGKAATQNQQSWTGMFNAIRLFLTAGIVREITSITLGLATMRGNIEGVSKAFDKLPNAKIILNDIRKATHGAIDDFKLMQLALKAENFGVPLKQLATLLEFAAVRSQQTGISIDYLTESIITGIGRKSIKILDNLQINIADLNHRVKDLGISYGEAVGQIANEQLQKMGGYLETSKTSVEQLSAELEKTKQILSSGWMGEAAGSFAKFIKEGIEGINNFLKGQQALREENAAEGVSLFLRQKESELSDRTKVVSVITNEIERRKNLIQSIKDEVREVEQKKAAGIGSLSISLSEVRAMEEYIKKLNDRKVTLNASIPLLQSALNARLKDISLQEKEVMTLEKLKQKRDDLVNSYETEIDINDRKGFIAKKKEIDAINKQIDAYDDLLKSKGGNAEALDVEMTDMELATKILETYAKSINKVTKTKLDASDEAFQWEEDELEVVENVLTAWQDFFAHLRIGFEDSGKRAKSNAQQMADVVRQIKSTTSEVIRSIGYAEIDQEAQGYEIRIQNARTYYDKLIDLAGDNERRKVELQLRRDKELKKLEQQKDAAETRAAKRKVYLDAAIAVGRAFADYEYPYSLIISALAGASALAQINEINKAPRGYAKGVINLKGPGTETSDSIHAMLSKGESVLTAEETRANMKNLHAIKAGKLNDKVIERIVQGQIQVVGSDDYKTAAKIDELIKITKANRPLDIIEKHSILYKVDRKSATSKKYIRSKYGNFE